MNKIQISFQVLNFKIAINLRCFVHIYAFKTCSIYFFSQFDIVNTLVKWRHMQHFLRKKIAEHRDTFDADNIRDFLDLYLESEQKQVQQGLKNKTC